MQRTTLLRGGHLLTMDDELGELRGDVLVVGDRIEAVAERIDADADEVLDVSRSIVLPGLVDTHVHLWQAPVRGLASGCWGREYFGIVHPLSARLRPTDLYAATFDGAAELLTHGVTTAPDFCHSTNSPAHTHAALDALADVGIRALFGFSFRERPEMTEQGFASFADRVSFLDALRSEWAGHPRVRLAAALNNIDHVTPEAHALEVSAARELGLHATIHCNLQEQVTQADEQGLLGPDLLWVHTGAISDQELLLLRERGGAIVCTPEIEAGQMTVTPVVARALRSGVPISFGSDAPSVVNGDLLAQLRIGHSLIRMIDAQTEHLQGRSGARTAWAPSVDAPGLLRMATIDSAEILGIADEIGSLTPGKQADIAVMPVGPFGLGGATSAEHLLFHSSGRPLDAVFVGGRMLIRHGELVGVDTAEMVRGLATARDWVLGRAPGAIWADIDEATRARYEAGQGRAQV